MANIKMSIETGTALNALLKEKGMDYAELDNDTAQRLANLISQSPKVTNSALLYLSCDSERAPLMRERLVRDVTELYERIY